MPTGPHIDPHSISESSTVTCRGNECIDEAIPASACDRRQHAERVITDGGVCIRPVLPAACYAMLLHCHAELWL